MEQRSKPKVIISRSQSIREEEEIREKDCGPHRCSVRVEPTTSCESHYETARVHNVSRETTRRYEADDEKSSADTVRKQRKTPYSIRPSRVEEDSSESLLDLPRSSKATQARAPPQMIDDSSEELVAYSKTRQTQTQRQNDGEENFQRRSKKSQDSVNVGTQVGVEKIKDERRSNARKTILVSDDDMDQICSAVSRNISVPHICTRKTFPCSESCTTHVIKDIDENTRVCACAKKHPDLFDDIRGQKRK
jgi:hypothetical protein